MKRHEEREHRNQEAAARRQKEEEEEAAAIPQEPELTPSGRLKRRAASKASAKVMEAISYLKKASADEGAAEEDLESGDEGECFRASDIVDLKGKLERVTAEDGGRNFRCELCLEVFDSKVKGEEHLVGAHSEELNQEDDDDDLSDAMNEEDDDDFDDSTFDDSEVVDFDSLDGRGRGRWRPRVRDFERARPLVPCTEMVQLEAKFRDAHFHKNAFSQLHSRRVDWTVLSEVEVAGYLPPMETSIPFSSKLNTEAAEASAPKCLKRFTASKEKRSLTLFAGGPIWAADWLPTSSASEGNYLALSADLNTEQEQNISSKSAARGLIQIWKFSEDFSEAECCLCIAHDYGKVWCLRWCPSGNASEAPTSEHLPRLGLLSAACSDGAIHLLSVCRPESLPGASSPVFVRTRPSLSLVSQSNSRGPARHCLKLSWSRRVNHRVIAGAFSDGSFALWDILSEEDDLARDGNRLYPYKMVAKAHASSINGIDLADASASDDSDLPSELVTGSSDRVCSVWSLDDASSSSLSRPRQSVKRGLVTDVSWLRHHPAQVAVSFDDVFLQSHTHSVVFEFSDGCTRTHPIIAQNAAVWSQSYNPWLNVLLAATATGELIVFMGPQVERALEHDKETKKRRAYVYRTEVQEEEGEEESASLCFVDMVADVQNAPLSELKRAWYPEQMALEDLTRSRVASIHRVAQNTNPHTLGWVFSGGQAGIGRVQALPACTSNQVRKALAAVEKN